MSDVSNSLPSPELLDELSAYLDGELDPADSRRVEELLARDPAIRAEVQRLEQAWYLLDELPRADVGEAFTRSTVEMVAIAAQDECSQQAHDLPRQKRLQRLAVTAGVLVAAVVGFLVMRQLSDHSNDRLLADLNVLDRLEEYRQAGEIEFVLLLARQNVFPADEKSAADAELRDPRAQIAGMSPAEKAQLKQKQERLAALPATEQDRLRDLDLQLNSDPKSDALRVIMSDYHDWLKNQHPAVREQLRQAPPQARLDRVLALRREEEFRSQNQLSLPDREVVLAWLDGIVRSKLEADKLKQWEQMRPDERRIALRNQMQARIAGAKGKTTPEWNLEQVMELYRNLSPAARQLLDSRPHPAGKRQLIAHFIMQSLRSPEMVGFERLASMVTDDEIERFRQTDLTPRQQAELERLKPNERQRRLRMMYLNKKYPDQPWRQFRPGDALPDKSRPRPGTGGKQRGTGPSS